MVIHMTPAEAAKHAHVEIRTLPEGSMERDVELQH